MPIGIYPHKPQSEEHIRKRVKFLIGKRRPNWVRIKISEAKKGKPNGLLGKKRPPFSEEWKNKISKSLLGKPGNNKGKHWVLSQEIKDKMSRLAKNRGSGKWTKGRKVSEETKRKLSLAKIGHIVSLETRLKISNALKGEKHHFWKGGITPINKIIRKSYEYKLWRKAVFERDDYACRFCGRIGGDLEADHIKPFAYYPELRFAIDNGRTLCKGCHQKTDSWGNKLKKIYDKQNYQIH